MTKLSVVMLMAVSEAAERLGVTTRQVQHLAAQGSIRMVARGIVDATSVDRHLAVHATTHRRAWSETTAWGAVALLSGVTPEWLGASQSSRLKGRLRDLSAPRLVERARQRARVSRYVGHGRSADRIAAGLVTAASDPAAIGLAESPDVDGYVSNGDLSALVRRHGLRRDDAGRITLRATSVNLAIVERLAEAGPVLAALDLAEALDVRQREVGMEILATALVRIRA